MLRLLHFQRQKHATIPARNTITRIPPTRTGVEKKGDSSGEVIDEFRAGLVDSIPVADIRAGVAISSTVTVGNPALENSLLILLDVSLTASS